jgi:hypothetical protein
MEKFPGTLERQRLNNPAPGALKAPGFFYAMSTAPNASDSAFLTRTTLFCFVRYSNSLKRPATLHALKNGRQRSTRLKTA